MRGALLGLLALALGACGAEDLIHEPSPATLDGFPTPPGFPPPALPEDNPYTEARFALGRWLFYDPRLSATADLPCAGCHDQARAFADGPARSVGIDGDETPHNALPLFNVAWANSLNWANPNLTTLEQQILVPLFGDAPVEMGALRDPEGILDRLRADLAYEARFAAAFPALEAADRVTWPNVVQALATFVRGLISADSPFDRAARGDPLALSAPARRGATLFFSERLECHHCHGGFNLSAATTHAGAAEAPSAFHNTGVYRLDPAGAYPASAPGLFGATGDPADHGRFRTPSLRNVAVTAPYLHDGSVASLGEVIDLYAAGGRHVTEGPYAGDGRANPNKSAFIHGFSLSLEERADLLAFLESLTDEGFLSDPRFRDPFAP